MKNKKFRSIRVKLVLILSLTAILAIFVSSTVQFWYTYQEDKDNALQTLTQTASILGENLSASLEFDDKDSATLILSALKLSPNVEVAYLLKDKETVFAHYFKNDVYDKGLVKEALQLYKVNGIKEHITFNDIQSLIVSEPIYFEGQYLASFMLIANTTQLQESLKRQFISQLVISGFITIFIIFFAMYVQKGFTLPIFSLKRAMDDVRKNSNYNTQIEFQTNDEFQSLFDGFNKMIKTIKNQLNMVKIAEKKQHELYIKNEAQKTFTQILLDSQEQMIITTDGKILLSANKKFYSFFAVETVKDFVESYHANCICNMFNKNAPKGYLQIKMEDETWIDYVISHPLTSNHKAMISMGDIDFIFSVTAAKLPGEKGLKSAVFTDITKMENAKLEIENIHKHTRQSIEYAALIQSALIPDNEKFRKYFKDFFALWHPKDLVGGDIYLFEELRHDDECLLMVIDCTGHGVPGAFVTMLVKALERQIVSHINNGDEAVSPANLLAIFNRSMKDLLKQKDKTSISNAGFDGQIMYYNKKEKIVKVASARNEIFYYQDNKLHVIKGDRHSVGYKDSDADYEFKEHIIDVSKETTMYISSDGYWDQNGGEKKFPFGKKRLKKMLDEIHMESMADQQEEFIYQLEDYKNGFEQNDDVTVIGLKI